jgi:hypothetical protein
MLTAATARLFLAAAIVIIAAAVIGAVRAIGVCPCAP